MHEIAIITQYFYPSSAASSQLMTDLACGLAERSYCVKVFTGTRNTTEITSQSLDKLEVSRSLTVGEKGHGILAKVTSSLFFIVGSLAYIVFHVPKHVPILIASNPPYAGILGLFFRLFKGGKFYFLLQDVFPESAVFAGFVKQKSISFIVFKYLNYLVCKYSCYTIVLSSAMQRFIEQTTGLKEKFRVIENWSIENIHIWDKQDNPFAIQYGFHKIFTVLYSGNMGRLHDIESIAEAVNLLKNSPIQFVFIGDGPKKKLLEQAIEKYQLKNILILPFQPREKISLSLTACDISLVSLISGAEQIVAPSKLYGILASGRAVVSISAPGSDLENLLTVSQCGVNCPPNHPQKLADIITKLAAEPLRVKSMGQNARKLYEERYIFKRALDEYENLLFNNPQP
ncbi:MAG: glycosyltransferase family 4 protein [Stigonema ocellatum SAG 48.90 = DSM 106950]|nr:glycosyltransferase family 4 protein [Stigonema ocellatum SAG 48.90 = DSM 106950]